MSKGSWLDREAILSSLQSQLDGVREAIDEEDSSVIRLSKDLLREAYSAISVANDRLSLEIEDIVHDLLAMLQEEDRQQVSGENASIVDHEFESVD